MLVEPEDNKTLNNIRWFQKHLNWTVMLIIIGSGITGYLFIRLILLFAGSSHLTISGSSYIYDFPVGVSIANILSILGFAWILKQKKRSLWFLLFFIPLLIPLPLPPATILLEFPFWIIGIVVVLKLDTKN
jgi:hypothetical protein